MICKDSNKQMEKRATLSAQRVAETSRVYLSPAVEVHPLNMEEGFAISVHTFYYMDGGNIYREIWDIHGDGQENQVQGMESYDERFSF